MVITSPVINIAGKNVQLVTNGVSRAGKQRWKGQVYVEGLGTVFINTYSKADNMVPVNVAVKQAIVAPTPNQDAQNSMRQAVWDVLTELATSNAVKTQPVVNQKRKPGRPRKNK